MDIEPPFKRIKRRMGRRPIPLRPPLDPIDKEKLILLKSAMNANNISLIKKLLSTGYSVFVGGMALKIALKKNKYRAARVLLLAGVDVTVNDVYTDNETALRLLMSKWVKVINKMLPYFIYNLRRGNYEIFRLLDLLVDGNWPFPFIYRIRNDQLIEKYLMAYRMCGNCVPEMLFAIGKLDLKVVELILCYGGALARRTFVQRAPYFLMLEEMMLWKIFYQSPYIWRYIERQSMNYVERMFTIINTEYLQLLMGFEVHKHVLEIYGMELRMSMFENDKVDACELLHNQSINVNLKPEVLHKAVDKVLFKNVQFLLDSGVDVNVKDESGNTPLFYALKKNNLDCGKLLLAYDADVSIKNKQGVTLCELALNINSPLIETLIRHLTIRWVYKLSVEEKFFDIIYSYENFRKIYYECVDEIQNLMKCEIANPITLRTMGRMTIVKSISLHTILAEDIEKIDRYVANQNLISLIEQHNKQYELNSFYYYTLKFKAVKATNLYNFKCEIANIISSSTGQSVSYDNLIMKEISKHLSHKDISTFLNVYRGVALQ